MVRNTSFQVTLHWPSHEKYRGIYHIWLYYKLWTPHQIRHTYIPIPQIRRNLGKKSKITPNLRILKQIYPKQSINYYTWYIPLVQMITDSAHSSYTYSSIECIEKKSRIGWLQALTVILSHGWYDTQNLYLQLLSANISGQRLILSPINKLWGMAWWIWNVRNHTMYGTDAPTKY